MLRASLQTLWQPINAHSRTMHLPCPPATLQRMQGQYHQLLCLNLLAIL